MVYGRKMYVQKTKKKEGLNEKQNLARREIGMEA